ncbi:MAG: hypothetical protein FD181_3732 [Prolixibacteraceae bacterium]|nr:MAG: hypothetical protein FD181_3732 [Prolixibacteraceae bacterium]
MDQSNTFNLDNEINQWFGEKRTNPSFTASDREELKCHLYEIIDALIEKGLDEEEAFVVAKMRLDIDSEMEKEYNEGNKPILQMRRSLLILAGVLVYFMLYYFILSTSKILIIALQLNDVSKTVTIEWVSRYLLTWHFLIAIFFVSLYFLESKTINFIEKLKLKPKGTIALLAIAALLAIIDTCLFPIVKNMLERNIPVLSILYQNYNYFEFSFP